MNKIKKISGGVAALCIWFNINAQEIKFDATTHDFGNISEEMGKAVHSFQFTNTGNKPLVITNVKASCGCTTPKWTKEPVRPGETGEVVAEYRTSPGSFNKNLTVTTNGSPASVVLYIKGNVSPKPEDLRATYPQTFGKLNARNRRDISFSQVHSRQISAAQYIEVANAGDEPVAISFENVPDYLIVNAAPAILEPRKKGQITVSVNGAKVKLFGYHDNSFVVKTGDLKETIRVVDVVAEKMEIPKAANNVEAPKFPASEVEQSFVDMGTVKPKSATSSFEVKNVGNDELVIKSFTTDNPSFAQGYKNEVKIKPGDKGRVKFAARNLKQGENTAQVYLSTNDPGKPLLKFTVKALVQ
ncbi:MAG: DUF1573 domain-containing protein [Prevotellaceae bacterium]|jgi:hypothetical protein|nr:DUF1573 domain-containing protein [Prevotellaceae bacterium]